MLRLRAGAPTRPLPVHTVHVNNGKSSVLGMENEASAACVFMSALMNIDDYKDLRVLTILGRLSGRSSSRGLGSLSTR